MIFVVCKIISHFLRKEADKQVYLFEHEELSFKEEQKIKRKVKTLDFWRKMINFISNVFIVMYVIVAFILVMLN